MCVVQYKETERDMRYGGLLSRRFGELAATGDIAAWREYGSGEGGRLIVDLVTPGEAVVTDLRMGLCRDLWWPLYDSIGLIN